MDSPSPRCILLFVFLPLLLLFFSLGLPRLSSAQSLKITSDPPGATVELDGVPVGTTPFEKKFPGGFFHRTRTVLGERLDHPMVARLSLRGFVTHEVTLTEGPMDWIDLHGRHHGQYWLFKSDHFHADLETVAGVFTGTVSVTTAIQPVARLPELSLEELVRRTKPAVVYLETGSHLGSGFFVTETGVIATNAHVARGNSNLLTVLPNGAKLQATVVYIDPVLDLALVKVAAPSPNFAFPCLPLADSSQVHQGEPVLVIGNPSEAMLFSATKGIVSAVGKIPDLGPGTWIQTDAPINPGNSGGPMINTQGEVIGINSAKIVRNDINGIAFALSSGDLLRVLRRFYPALAPAPAQTVIKTSARSSEAVPNSEELAGASSSALPESSTASPTTNSLASSSDRLGTIVISSDLDSVEIFVDGKFLGNTPATLRLPAGPHTFVLKSTGFPDYSRTLDLPKSSKLTLKAIFQPQTAP